MRYAMLIYNDESIEPTAEQRQQIMTGYYDFTDEVRDKGIMQAADALQPAGTATSVRVRNGQTETTDGPFAETKEQLGGFYLLECKDLDEAIAYAAKIPSAQSGTIEVRPIMEIPPRN